MLPMTVSCSFDALQYLLYAMQKESVTTLVLQNAMAGTLVLEVGPGKQRISGRVKVATAEDVAARSCSTPYELFAAVVDWALVEQDGDLKKFLKQDAQQGKELNLRWGFGKKQAVSLTL